MGDQKPTIGRIVLYRLSEGDIKSIGEQAMNGLASGDYVPALITRVWSDTTINAKLFLDGRDMPLTKTSTSLGENVGNWKWPDRI